MKTFLFSVIALLCLAMVPAKAQKLQPIQEYSLKFYDESGNEKMYIGLLDTLASDIFPAYYDDLEWSLSTALGDTLHANFYIQVVNGLQSGYGYGNWPPSVQLPTSGITAPTTRDRGIYRPGGGTLFLMDSINTLGAAYTRGASFAIQDSVGGVTPHTRKGAGYFRIVAIAYPLLVQENVNNAILSRNRLLVGTRNRAK